MTNKNDIIQNITKVTWDDWGGTTLDGTAVPSDVLTGVTFLSLNSEELQTGTMTNYGDEPTGHDCVWYNNYIYMRVPDGAESAGGFVRAGIKYPASSFGTAIASQVLNGQTFTSSAGFSVMGTMTNNGSITSVVSIGENNGNLSFRIPQGAYLTNASSGYPEVSTALANFGNAIAPQVLSGYTFTSSIGLNAIGTMTNNGAISATINAGGSYTIPAGYHNGSGKVTANSVNTYFSVGLWMKRNSGSGYYELRVGDSSGSGGKFRFYDWTGESTRTLGTLICNNGNWSKK